MASASYLRARTLEEWAPFVPQPAMELYRQAAAEGQLLDTQRLETALLVLLRATPMQNFAQVRGISEGLENRLAAAVREADGPAARRNLSGGFDAHRRGGTQNRRIA